MYNAQKQYEETVTVINEGVASLSSGGISTITDATGVSINMLILPDDSVYREPRKEGGYEYEKIFAQVSRDEIAKAAITPGQTRIIWNGNTYKVYRKLDYTTKSRWQLAEIEMRRRIGNDL